MQLNVIKKFIVKPQDYVKYHFISLYFILSNCFAELRLNFKLNLKIRFLPLMVSGKIVFEGKFNQIGDTINRLTAIEIQSGLCFFNYFIKDWNINLEMKMLEVLTVVCSLRVWPDLLIGKLVSKDNK